MLDFANSTGLTDSYRPQRRYLWTDAFAVCNYLELYRQSDNQEYLQLALKLVDQVHHTLGKNRKNDTWLSGLSDEEAKLHPTLGGLRIGKQLDERGANEPFDDRLEWQRDGQYYHYLTKWMHALNSVSRVTHNGVYNQWAMELAQVSHAAFTYTSGKGDVKKMVWKMSVDLSRPLIESMGQHDPLDGWITYQELVSTAALFPDTENKINLKAEIEDLTATCSEIDWKTADSLGIGGLLSDAYRLVQLICNKKLSDDNMLKKLLEDINISLKVYAEQNTLNLSAKNRLAFRELGLAIGLSAIHLMQSKINQNTEHFRNINQLNFSLSQIKEFYPLFDFIKNFWSEPKHCTVNSWTEHADINNIMLATCLAPDSYLKI